MLSLRLPSPLVAFAVVAAGVALAKPNSNFGGVQIGINVPYSFRGMRGSADDVIRNMLELGLNSAELRSQPVEHFLGGPVHIQGEQTATEASRVFPGGFNRPTPEQEAEERAHIEEIRKWRLALPRKRFAEALQGLRRQFFREQRDRLAVAARQARIVRAPEDAPRAKGVVDAAQVRMQIAIGIGLD